MQSFGGGGMHTASEGYQGSVKETSLRMDANENFIDRDGDVLWGNDRNTGTHIDDDKRFVSYDENTW